MIVQTLLLTADERRAYAYTRRSEGLTYREIGVELGVGPDAARNLAERHFDDLVRKGRIANDRAARARQRWLARKSRAETLIAVADWFNTGGGNEAFARFTPQTQTGDTP